MILQYLDLFYHLFRFYHFYINELKIVITNTNRIDRSDLNTLADTSKVNCLSIALDTIVWFLHVGPVFKI